MEENRRSQNASVFIRLLKTGKLPKAILPNNSPNYTLGQEKLDTKHYVNDFLNSSSYDFIKKSEAVEYNGE
ncbi:MAG: hypothetical protein HDT46_07330 [Ruminococcaceae bacterium]|nr:hypothetical protein [Oscillospiraceae bacterium]